MRSAHASVIPRGYPARSEAPWALTGPNAPPALAALSEAAAPALGTAATALAFSGCPSKPTASDPPQPSFNRPVPHVSEQSRGLGPV